MFINIANELVEILPSNWVRCFFYSEMTEKAYRSAFYTFFDDSEEPVHCNELLNLGVSSQQLQKTLENIFQIYLNEIYDYLHNYFHNQILFPALLHALKFFCPLHASRLSRLHISSSYHSQSLSKR